MKTIIAALLLLSLFAACAHKREVRSYRLHGSACQQLGYRSGSDAWADCTQELERSRLSRLKEVTMDTADRSKTLTCKFGGKTTCE